MDTIRQYAPDSDEHVKLDLAAFWLTHFSTKGTRYETDDCYFDLGQNWMWTTIIATRSDGDTYQVLCPRDHEKIIRSQDILATVKEIMADKYWHEL